MRRGVSGACCATSPLRTFAAAQVAKRRASGPAPLLSPRFASQNRSGMEVEALEKRSQAEQARWDKEKGRLDAALQRARGS
jgi:hypothetical protein